MYMCHVCVCMYISAYVGVHMCVHIHGALRLMTEIMFVLSLYSLKQGLSPPIPEPTDMASLAVVLGESPVSLF